MSSRKRVYDILGPNHHQGLVSQAVNYLIYSLIILAVLSAIVMFYAEHDAQPNVFPDIPSSILWAIATLTNVGHSDPATALGKCMASGVDLLGLTMLALPTGPSICSEDRQIVRELARRVVDIASWHIMAKRRNLWRRHNAMEPGRPLIYVDPQGAWSELIPENTLRCRDEAARRIELVLRRRIYVAEHFSADNVIEPEWVVRKVIHNSGWGLIPRRTHSDNVRGAFGFEPVILATDDLKKLRFPEIVHDAAATRDQHDFFQALFGDILEIKLKGVDDLSYHLMNQYTALRGLQEVLVDMIDNPQMLHDAMAFLEEGHRQVLRQYMEQDLLRTYP